MLGRAGAGVVGCQAGSGSSWNIFGKGVTGTGMRSMGGKCGLTD